MRTVGAYPLLVRFFLRGSPHRWRKSSGSSRFSPDQSWYCSRCRGFILMKKGLEPDPHELLNLSDWYSSVGTLDCDSRIVHTVMTL